MKFGCGCLTSLMVLAVPVVLAGGAVWVASRALQPAPLDVAQTTPADGVAAQQKIFEMLRRVGAPGQHASSPPVVLSERDLNAFLSRHLVQVADVPLRRIAVKLIGAGTGEFGAQLPLRYVLAEPPLTPLAAHLPARWLDRPVSIRVRARVSVEPGAPGHRRLRLEVERSWVGQQAIPVVVLRLGLDPGVSRLLSWELPDSVEAVTIAPGRAVVRLASSR